ncbi:SHOCT domain-containing protein [Cupriavidus sp. IK-TO18]|uniref:SHOCT domain-containing protein n=1 Tax=Cupriavidus sp. IK-TO18 TaxID=2782182 RepID=UPI001899A78C|nr:SHOCT domain-containing protein [Cupriavidus sp. IK-TO18]MBF6986752.1 SHOCT domain-containing protein [Cupriavidus sp. IK-TO18]
MSTKGELLYHPINGTTEETWDGFSWPAFLFGIIWLAIKQLWVHFIACLVLLFVTAGFAAIPIWIFYGGMGNSFHKKALLSKGYLTQAQYEQRQGTSMNMSAAAAESRNTTPSHPSIADELAKLVQLRDSGALTEIEFSEQKRKLLSS